MSQIKNTTEYWKNIEEEEDNIMKNEKMDMVAVENTVVEKEHENMENKIVSMGFVPETDIVRIKQGIMGGVEGTDICIKAIRKSTGNKRDKIKIEVWDKVEQKAGEGEIKENITVTDYYEFTRFDVEHMSKKDRSKLFLNEFQSEKDIDILLKMITENWRILPVTKGEFSQNAYGLLEIINKIYKERIDDEENYIEVKGKTINRFFNHDDGYLMIEKTYFEDIFRPQIKALCNLEIKEALGLLETAGYLLPYKDKSSNRKAWRTRKFGKENDVKECYKIWDLYQKDMRNKEVA